MRISDLFDGLDEQERNELLDLPEREAPAISVRDVRRRVNQTLDEDPAERRRHMKQVFKKGVCAALIAASLITGAFAASQMDFWHEWFANGTGDLDINTEKQSIDNGDVQLTLEETLSDETVVYIVYSLVGLTEEGQRLINDDSYVSGIDCAISVWDTETETAVGQQWGAAENFDTPEKRYFHMTLFPENHSLALRLRGSQDTIAIPATNNVAVAEVTLPDISFVNYAGETDILHSVRLTSLGYYLDYTLASERKSFWAAFEYQFYMAMKDGSIRSWAQQGATLSSGDEQGHTGLWDNVLDVDQAEGIIIDGIEYFFDGRAPVERTVPAEYQLMESPTWRDDAIPFLGAPLRSVIAQLGGTVIWDNETQSATATFRGVSCVCKDGDYSVYRDGRIVYTADHPLVKIIGNTMYVDSSVLEDGLDIAVFDFYDRADAASGQKQTIWCIAI